jgi:hypothetical protein
VVRDVNDKQVVAAYGAKLVLVRPDGHVAWRSNQPPPDAGHVLETVTGHR